MKEKEDKDLSGETPVEPQDESLKPRAPEFEWGVYAEATLAGLAVLIPVPLLDWAVETYFRRRMPKSIARYRKVQVAPASMKHLSAGKFSLAGCLFFPVQLVLEFVKRAFRTVLYFLTIKAASDNLSVYWHRAYLLDRIISLGHADSPEHARFAAFVMDEVLREQTVRPMGQLAEEIVERVRRLGHGFRIFGRTSRADDVSNIASKRMARRWSEFAEHLARVGKHYDQRYAERVAAHAADKPST